MLSENMILTEVNHIKVYTINEYKTALMNVICTTDDDVITWKTIDGRIYVCSINLLLEEEKNLSENYKYKPIV